MWIAVLLGIHRTSDSSRALRLAAATPPDQYLSKAEERFMLMSVLRTAVSDPILTRAVPTSLR